MKNMQASYYNLFRSNGKLPRLVYQQEVPGDLIRSAEINSDRPALFREHPELETIWEELPETSRNLCQRIFVGNERVRLAARISLENSQETQHLFESLEAKLAGDLSKLLDGKSNPAIVAFTKKELGQLDAAKFRTGNLAYHRTLREFMVEEKWPPAIVLIADLVYYNNRGVLLADSIAPRPASNELETMRDIIEQASALLSVGEELKLSLPMIGGSDSSRGRPDLEAVKQGVSFLESSRYAFQLRAFIAQERSLAGL